MVEKSASFPLSSDVYDFVPDCWNRPFTAVTRVRISLGTPFFSKTYARPVLLNSFSSKSRPKPGRGTAISATPARNRSRSRQARLAAVDLAHCHASLARVLRQTQLQFLGPVPRPGQAPIGAAAAGVNFTDTAVRRGQCWTEMPLPHRMCVEGLVRILAVGDGVNSCPGKPELQPPEDNVTGKVIRIAWG